MSYSILLKWKVVIAEINFYLDTSILPDIVMMSNIEAF